MFARSSVRLSVRILLLLAFLFPALECMLAFLRKNSRDGIHALYAIDILPFTEPHARESEAVRLDMQQQVVRRHLHHPLPEQEGSLRGEDPPVAAHILLSGIRG